MIIYLLLLMDDKFRLNAAFCFMGYNDSLSVDIEGSEWLSIGNRLSRIIRTSTNSFYIL